MLILQNKSKTKQFTLAADWICDLGPASPLESATAWHNHESKVTYCQPLWTKEPNGCYNDSGTVSEPSVKQLQFRPEQNRWDKPQHLLRCKIRSAVHSLSYPLPCVHHSAHTSFSLTVTPRDGSESVISLVLGLWEETGVLEKTHDNMGPPHRMAPHYSQRQHVFVRAGPLCSMW